MMGEMKGLVSTLTMERQGLSLLRRCLAASGLSTPAHPGEGTGSAGGSVPASNSPP